MEGLKQGRSSEPIAQRTLLGWVITGPTGTDSRDKSPPFDSRVLHVSSIEDTVSISQQLRKFWELEEVPQEALASPEEEIL